MFMFRFLLTFDINHSISEIFGQQNFCKPKKLNYLLILCMFKMKFLANHYFYALLIFVQFTD